MVSTTGWWCDSHWLSQHNRVAAALKDNHQTAGSRTGEAAWLFICYWQSFVGYKEAVHAKQPQGRASCNASASYTSCTQTTRRLRGCNTHSMSLIVCRGILQLNSKLKLPLVVCTVTAYQHAAEATGRCGTHTATPIQQRQCQTNRDHIIQTGQCQTSTMLTQQGLQRICKDKNPPMPRCQHFCCQLLAANRSSSSQSWASCYRSCAASALRCCSLAAA